MKTKLAKTRAVLLLVLITAAISIQYLVSQA